MTKEEFENLRPRDLVKDIETGELFTVRKTSPKGIDFVVVMEEGGVVSSQWSRWELIQKKLPTPEYTVEIEKEGEYKGQKYYNFKEGGISEEKDFFILPNKKLDKYDHPCRHTKDGVTPFVVVATNEGGCNVTHVCVDCIIEAHRVVKDKEA